MSLARLAGFAHRCTARPPTMGVRRARAVAKRRRSAAAARRGLTNGADGRRPAAPRARTMCGGETGSGTARAAAISASLAWRATAGFQLRQLLPPLCLEQTARLGPLPDIVRFLRSGWHGFEHSAQPADQSRAGSKRRPRSAVRRVRIGNDPFKDHDDLERPLETDAFVGDGESLSVGVTLCRFPRRAQCRPPLHQPPRSADRDGCQRTSRPPELLGSGGHRGRAGDGGDRPR